MTPTEAHLKLLRLGYHVVPDQVQYTFYHHIAIYLNGKKVKEYDKALRNPKEINEAIEKTCIYLANKL